MTTDVFIDTNILLYAVSNHAGEIDKKWKARSLIETENFGLSLQVVQEFYVNATGKLAKSLPRPETLRFIEWLERFPIICPNMEIFHQAVDLRDRYQISYWDASIIAAAKTLGARIIYSEDLAHGQKYAGIKVINPFLELPTH